MAKRVVVAYEFGLALLWFAAMATLPVAAVAVTLEVVLRYGLRSPTEWAIDFAAFALLWITFLASPRLVRDRGHIAIGYAVAFLAPRVRHALEAVTAVAGAAVSAILLWAGLNATISAWISGALTIGSWEIPRAYVWSIIPIGSAFLVVEFVRFAATAGQAALRGEAKEPEQEAPVQGTLH